MSLSSLGGSRLAPGQQHPPDAAVPPAAAHPASHLGRRGKAIGTAVIGLGLLAMLGTIPGLADLVEPLLFALLGAVAALLLVRHRRPPAATPEAMAPDLAPLFDRGVVLARTLDGEITHWSAGCERLFGIPAAAALGQRAQELLGTRFPKGGLRTAQAVLLRDGEWHGELRHRCPASDALVVAAHWVLRRDPDTGAPLGVVELHADATALTAAEAALRAGEARLLLAQELAGVGTWEWDVETDAFAWVPAQHGLADLAPSPAGPRNGEPGSVEAFLAVVHPDDREAVRAAARRALETGEYECEFRILRPARDGTRALRWLIGRGRRLPGRAGRHGAILGVHVDITARKEAEERQALLMREVDHRAKNALAVVQAVLRLTRAESPEAFGRAIGGRVAALARAQTLLTESRWVGADLAALVQGELAPFLGDAEATRVTLDGPPVTIAPMAAQPLSMTLHELATNAAKYGALSVPGGSLELAWTLDWPADRLRLRWAERGGPAIAAPPDSRGFGSRMIRATIEDQLGGSLAARWEANGLVCEIAVPISRSVARATADEAPPGRSPAAPAVGGA
jgi:two-component sensor histidine kinase